MRHRRRVRPVSRRPWTRKAFSPSAAAASVVSAALFPALLVAVSGCQGQRGDVAAVRITGGDTHRGVAEIRAFGCGVCHVIPGIREARGVLGPPLNAWAERAYIGGEVPNSPGNLVKWIMDPPAIEPNTAMPDLGVTESQARDVAAYLYTLN